MQRLPFDLYWNLRLLQKYPVMERDSNGLAQEHLYSCLVFYQECKESWFRHWYLNIIRKREPSLNTRLEKAKEAVEDFEIIDVNESHKAHKIVTKKGAEWFRSLSIP